MLEEDAHDPQSPDAVHERDVKDLHKRSLGDGVHSLETLKYVSEKVNPSSRRQFLLGIPLCTSRPHPGLL